MATEREIQILIEVRNKATQAIAQVQKQLGTLENELKAIGAAAGKTQAHLARAGEEAARGATKAARAYETAAKANDSLIQAQKRAATSAAGLANAEEKVGIAYERAQAAARQYAASQERVEAAQKEVEQGGERAAEAQERYARAIARAQRDEKTYASALTQQHAALVAQSRAMAANENAAESLARAKDRLADAEKRAAAEMERFNQSTKRSNLDFRQLGDNMRNAGIAMGVGLTAPMVLGARRVLEIGSSFEDAMAGVRKTNFDAAKSAEENARAFAMLEDEIFAMTGRLPTTREELARVMQLAGQLGIRQKNLGEFAESMIRMGESSDLAADTAADAFARWANITQLPQDQIDTLANTVTGLGVQAAAAESEIVNMGLRIAGAGKQIGLSDAQIAAFATTLASVGVRAELGGSTISRVFADIGKAVAQGGPMLEKFAEVAGMSAEQFRRKFQVDAAGGVVAFIQGLQRMQLAGEDLFTVFEDLGEDGVRLRDILLRLTGSGDLLTEQLRVANDEWRKSNALVRISNERFQTISAQWQIAKNRLTALVVEGFMALRPMLIDIVNALADMEGPLRRAVDWFSRLSEPVKSFIVGLGVMVAAIGPLTFVVGTLISVIAGFVALTSGAVVVATFGAGAALIALGAALVVVIRHWDDITNKMPGVVSLFQALWRILGPVLNLLKDLAIIVGKITFAALRGVVEGLAKAFDDFAGVLADVLNFLSDLSAKTWTIVVQFVKDIDFGDPAEGISKEERGRLSPQQAARRAAERDAAEATRTVEKSARDRAAAEEEWIRKTPLWQRAYQDYLKENSKNFRGYTKDIVDDAERHADAVVRSAQRAISEWRGNPLDRIFEQEMDRHEKRDLTIDSFQVRPFDPEALKAQVDQQKKVIAELDAALDKVFQDHPQEGLGELIALSLGEARAEANLLGRPIANVSETMRRLVSTGLDYETVMAEVTRRARELEMLRIRILSGTEEGDLGAVNAELSTTLALADQLRAQQSLFSDALFDSANASIDSLRMNMQSLVDMNTDRAAQNISYWEKNLSEADQAMEILNENIEQNGGLTEKQAEQMRLIGWYQERLRGGIEEYKDELVDAVAIEAKHMQNMDHLNSLLEQDKITQEEYNQAVRDSAGAMQDALGKADWTGNIQRMADALDLWILKFDTLIDRMSSTDPSKFSIFPEFDNTEFEDAAGRFTNLFDNLPMEVQSNTEHARQIWQGYIEQVLASGSPINDWLGKLPQELQGYAQTIGEMISGALETGEIDWTKLADLPPELRGMVELALNTLLGDIVPEELKLVADLDKDGSVTPEELRQYYEAVYVPLRVEDEEKRRLWDTLADDQPDPVTMDLLLRTTDFDEKKVVVDDAVARWKDANPTVKVGIDHIALDGGLVKVNRAISVLGETQINLPVNFELETNNLGAATDAINPQFQQAGKDLEIQIPVTAERSGFDGDVASIKEAIRIVSGETMTPSADLEKGLFMAGKRVVENDIASVSAQVMTPKAGLDAARFYSGVAGVETTRVGMDGRRFTIYAELDTSAYDSAAARLGRNQPLDSPAKEGPLSRTPDWNYMTEGIAPAMAAGIEAYQRGAQALAEQQPLDSPAQRGPLSRAPKWEYLTEGIGAALARGAQSAHQGAQSIAEALVSIQDLREAAVVDMQVRLDTAPLMSGVLETREFIRRLETVSATPRVGLDTLPFEQAVAASRLALDGLDRARALPEATLDTFDLEVGLTQAGLALAAFAGRRATASAALETIDLARALAQAGARLTAFDGVRVAPEAGLESGALWRRLRADTAELARFDARIYAPSATLDDAALTAGVVRAREAIRPLDLLSVTPRALLDAGAFQGTQANLVADLADLDRLGAAPDVGLDLTDLLLAGSQARSVVAALDRQAAVPVARLDLAPLLLGVDTGLASLTTLETARALPAAGLNTTPLTSAAVVAEGILTTLDATTVAPEATLATQGLSAALGLAHLHLTTLDEVEARPGLSLGVGLFDLNLDRAQDALRGLDARRVTASVDLERGPLLGSMALAEGALATLDRAQARPLATIETAPLVAGVTGARDTIGGLDGVEARPLATLEDRPLRSAIAGVGGLLVRLSTQRATPRADLDPVPFNRALDLAHDALAGLDAASGVAIAGLEIAPLRGSLKLAQVDLATLERTRVEPDARLDLAPLASATGQALGKLAALSAEAAVPVATLDDRAFRAGMTRTRDAIASAETAPLSYRAQIDLGRFHDALVEIDAHLPHSAAKTGPLARRPNWSFLTAGLERALGEGARLTHQGAGAIARFLPMHSPADAGALATEPDWDYLFAGLEAAASKHSKGTLEHIKTFVDAARGAFDAMKLEIDLAKALEEGVRLPAPNDPRIAELQRLMEQAVRDILAIAETLSEDEVNKAKLFADAASSVMGAYQAALDAFAGDVAIPDLGVVSAIKVAIEHAVVSLLDTARYLESIRGEGAGGEAGAFGKGTLALFEMLKMAADALTALAGLSIPDNAQITRLKVAIEHAVLSIVDTAQYVASERGELDSRGFMADAQAIVDLLAGAVEAFTGLSDLAVPTDQAITRLKFAIEHTLLSIVDTARSIVFHRGALETDAFVESAVKIMDLVGAAVEAFAEIETLEVPSAEALTKLRYAIAFIVAEIGYAAGELEAGGVSVSAAGTLGEHAQRVVEMVTSAVEAFNALGDVQIPGREIMIKIRHAVQFIVAEIGYAAGELGEDLVSEAGTFAEQAIKVVDLVGSALEVFSEPARIRLRGGIIDHLGVMIEEAVREIRGVAITLGGSGAIEDASDFADKAGEIIGVLSDALDLFGGESVTLAQRQGIVFQLKPLIEAAVQAIREAATTIEGPVLQEAYDFSIKAREVVGLIGDTFAAFSPENLFADPKGVGGRVTKQFGFFFEALGEMAKLVGDDAGRFDVLREVAGAMADVMESVVAAVEAVNLAGMVNLGQRMVFSIVAGIRSASGALTNELSAAVSGAIAGSSPTSLSGYSATGTSASGGATVINLYLSPDDATPLATWIVNLATQAIESSIQQPLSTI